MIYLKKTLRRQIKKTRLFQKYRHNKRYGVNKPIVYYSKDKVLQFERLLTKVKIIIDPSSIFQHWIDTSIDFCNLDVVLGNMPPNYENIVDKSVNELINELNVYNNDVANSSIRLLHIIDKYLDRVIIEIEKQESNENIQRALTAFKNMKSGGAESLYEAFQRILFWSSLFWQSGHKLIGLGRLDVILSRFSTDSNVDIIISFLEKLHDYYEYKSSSLLGDIGQIIIVGGMEKEGYFKNQLTYDFISAVQRTQFPDPKVLLRVSSVMPDSLLDKALECISTGVGAPLLANDDIIVPALIKFGYDQEDAYNYVTSACWEPLVYGKSFDQNNLYNIQFAKVFSDMMKDNKILLCRSFEDLYKIYIDRLTMHISDRIHMIQSLKWEPDPLFTLLTPICIESGKDIAAGGAKYNNCGILSVGLGNVVDSLLNVRNSIFDTQEMTLMEMKKIASNPLEMKNHIKKLKEKRKYYCHDDSDSIHLMNAIIQDVNAIIASYNTPLGGKFKWGLSSPGYITEGIEVGATFDGRNAGDPLYVHISTADSAGYTEIVKFATSLNYDGCNSNGNVIDLMISPNLILDNIQKFRQFIKSSILLGFFEMQMNVVSSKTLIEARKCPEKFPNLIVRVWGFSAYFKDLPNEYQDMLIKRALLNEGAA